MYIPFALIVCILGGIYTRTIGNLFHKRLPKYKLEVISDEELNNSPLALLVKPVELNVRQTQFMV